MNPNEIEEVASRIVKLSQDAMSERLTRKADELLRMAASLELMSPELQNCWGGPLNGQEGRRAIFRELIKFVGFDAILETGTYRGLTTAWFADLFSGPIYSCEIDKRYHYQAQINLSVRENVHLTLEDSRQFLRRSLAALPESGRYFVYLDAHWRDDLPLAEEVLIILDSTRNCVIAIDDFKVPADDYKFDDYGPGKVISLELLKQFKDEPIRFFFPKLRASDETGAASGVCIIATGLAAEVQRCELLQGNSWTQWRDIESADDAARQSRSIDVIAQGESESPQAQPEPSQEISEITFSQTEDMDTVKSGIASLLESQGSLYGIIEKYANSLNERLEAIDDRREMGRALIDLKAKNLELERQKFRLNEELSNLSIRKQELKQQNQRLEEELRNLTQTTQASPTAVAEAIHIKNLVESLARSRMINTISVIAPKARQTVVQLTGRLDQLIHNLETTPTAGTSGKSSIA